MHELDEYSPKAILEWLDEHEKYAVPLWNRGKHDPCRGLAASILGCVKEMRAALTQYEQPEQRRREFHLKSINDWKKEHSGHDEPPQDVLQALNVEAAKRAFLERYPELAQLSGNIAEMRTDAESKFKC